MERHGLAVPAKKRPAGEPVGRNKEKHEKNVAYRTSMSIFRATT